MSRGVRTGAAAAAVAVLAWLWLGHGGRARGARAVASVPVTSARGGAVERPTLAAAPAATASAAAGEDGKEGDAAGGTYVHRKALLAGVTVEPAAPCAGQDVLVTATLVAGAPPSKVVVAGAPGNPRVVRFDRPGRQRLEVLARDYHDGYDVWHGEVDVGDCTAADQLDVAVAQVGEELAARVTDPASIDPASVVWDWGDGATGRGAFAEHDSWDRPQALPTSTFVVTVRATGVDGRARTGRRAVTLENPLAIEVATGTAALPVRYTPFPSRDGAIASIDVELADILPVRADFTHAEVRSFPCAGGAPVDRMGPIGDVTDLREVDAGARTRFAVRLDTAALPPDTCRALVRLHGGAGPLALDVPLAIELGQGADAVVVDDPARLDELRRARALLGRVDGPITEDDLARLRAEGRL
ncbi:MAG TPA: hypothetical protein VHE35_19700 [Kofleriaceae bacterium]|nr:hypothetical protein [Kofleriaceae bacterium]